MLGRTLISESVQHHRGVWRTHAQGDCFGIFNGFLDLLDFKPQMDFMVFDNFYQQIVMQRQIIDQMFTSFSQPLPRRRDLDQKLALLARLETPIWESIVLSFV